MTEATKAANLIAALAIHRPKELHLAPMLDVSNREFRQLLRILSNHCVLWTEMVVDETLAYSNDIENHLGYDENTHPIICQIGGNSPEFTFKASRAVQDYGYDEINFNMDCPSSRVSVKREFGAVLMKKIDTAVAVMNAMHDSAKSIPISVKCRIGIDDFDDLDHVASVIRRLKPVCQRFYLHARKCILGGILSPAQNRIVPPLNYPRVYQLCDMFQDCEFWINGGIPGLEAAKLISYGGAEACEANMDNDHDTHRHHTVPCALCKASNGSCTAPRTIAPPNLRGCMLGRAAIDNPSMFWDVDRYFYDQPCNPCKNRRQALEQYCLYLERIYPRRCCDVDDGITLKIEAAQVVHDEAFCDECREMYGGEDVTRDAPEAVGECRKVERNKTKISSRVIDRSLKPVLGIFFGLPKSKLFRRVCDELGRDLRIRNCGPGFILRMALEAMPAEILDQDFVMTEYLLDRDVIAHVAPWNGGSQCCSTSAP